MEIPKHEPGEITLKVNQCQDCPGLSDEECPVGRLRNHIIRAIQEGRDTGSIAELTPTVQSYFDLYGDLHGLEEFDVMDNSFFHGVQAFCERHIRRRERIQAEREATRRDRLNPLKKQDGTTPQVENMPKERYTIGIYQLAQHNPMGEQ